MNSNILIRRQPTTGRRRVRRLARVLSALLLLSTQSTQAELIPSARLVDWTPGVNVGVVGGIPTNRTRIIDVTQAPYNADKTGETNAAPGIQAAVKAAVAGDVVYLPAGRYRIEAPILIGPEKDNITLRGAGMALTTIENRSPNSAISVGSGSDYLWSWPPTGNVIPPNTLQKNATTLALADTSAFSVGQFVRIAFDNQQDDTAITQGAVPVVCVTNWPRLRGQISKVTAKTSSNISVFPPIYYQPDPNLSGRVNVAQAQSDGVGVEDLTVDSSNGTGAIALAFEQCSNSWAKNVKSVKTNNYHIYFFNSMNCEVRRCVLDSRRAEGSNGGGILVNSSSASLFEDNIVLRMFPAVEVNQGSSGNVFAYNVFEDPRVNGVFGCCVNTNHGPHNSFNLYEGNITSNFQADGYFGSASDDTIFRNWVHGSLLDKSQNSWILSLNRFTRNYSIVGNLLGTTTTTFPSPYSFGNPNMGNSAFTGDAKPRAGDFWADWAALKAASAQGAGPGNNGFQERDLDVEATSVVKANYHFVASAIPATETLAGDTLPPSLFRSAKPGWFGELTWPPFDPQNPGNVTYERIPAGYRLVHGTDVPGGDAVAPGRAAKPRIVPK